MEIVSAGHEAWNAGDMDALGELFDPDCIIVRGLAGWPEPGPFVGREEVMRQWITQRAVFEVDTLEPIGDLIDFGDRVIARLTWHVAGGHGPDASMDYTVVYTLRKGKIFLFEFFWDHAEALEAVGLSEQDARANS